MTEQKIQDIELEIVSAKKNVSKTINNTIERGNNLEELEIKSEQLKENADMFHKQAKKVRWKIWLEKMKSNAVILTIVIIIILIIIAIILGIIY